MKRLKKFFKAFIVVLCLLGPIVTACFADEVLHSENYFYWLFAYFVTFPLAYVIIDES